MPTFTNQATLSYNDTTTNSNVVTGQLLETLSAVKTAVDADYRVGDDLTYAVSILNSGTTPLTGLTLTDDLGGYTVGTSTVYPLVYQADSLLYYVNGTLQPTPPVTAGPPLTVTGLSVPAGGNALLVYQAEVTSYAPPAAGSAIDNTVTITGGGQTGPVTATESVPAAQGPVLSISKSLSPSVVYENSTLTYTFTIQNIGNEDATATDGAVITDQFNPIISGLSVTFNGTAWTEGVQYTYNESTGLFVTNPGYVTIPAAVYAQDPVSGVWSVTPGTGTLVVTGTV